ncbi:MAG: elongation factor G, partial [Candidatus Methylomirabilis sp.]|nr:elongation factor G [Deltaproteobacteria bacterium]
HLLLAPLAPPPAMISFAITAKIKGEEDKIVQGLHRLHEEDPSVRIERSESTGDLLLSTLGQLHAEVTLEKLRRKFGVDAELHEPHVPYRETVGRKATAQGKYKKQSGGRGQYGDCHITIEPNPGLGFEYVDAIVGGSIPRQYIPAVEKGIVEAMKRGVLAHCPVVDVKVTCFDGSYHDVDSSEMAFKVAGSMAFKKACESAAMRLLEPIMAMEVVCPDDCLGDVIGDLNSRRGRVHGMESKGTSQVVKVSVPMAEVLKYAPDLRSLTSCRGSFSMEFERYEEAPPPVAQKIIAQVKREEAEEHE